MTKNDTVFEQTYQDYLTQISHRNLNDLKEILGLTIDNNKAVLSVFGKRHTISGNDIIGPSGKRPSFNTCIILSKYILMCPDTPTLKKGWVSYRDFKDSGPLLKFYANDVERPIAEAFSSKLEKLRTACKALDGYSPDIELAYDLCIQFDALPKIPLLLAFNDADKDFAASCSVLFQNDADKYLDAECLSMLGVSLFRRLTKASTI